jgi:hypothetical protein
MYIFGARTLCGLSFSCTKWLANAPHKFAWPADDPESNAGDKFSVGSFSLMLITTSQVTLIRSSGATTNFISNCGGIPSVACS